MFGYQGIQVIAIVYVLVVHSSCIGRTFERGGGYFMQMCFCGYDYITLYKRKFQTEVEEGEN